MATGLCGKINMNLLQRIAAIATDIADFFSKIPSKIRKFAGIAIPVVNSIKEKLDSDEAINLTEIIPGTWDNSLRTAASSMLGGLISIFKNVSESDADDKEKAKARKNLLMGMGSGLVALLDGDELPMNMYDMYTQIAYSKTKKDIADSRDKSSDVKD